jgi:hypothetical protein
MRFFLIGAAAVLTFSLARLADAAWPVGQVTGEALRKLVTGSMLRTTDDGGRPLTVALHRNGEAEGTAISPSQSRVSGSGTWTIDHDRLCWEMTWGLGRRSVTVRPCRTITWDGREFIESIWGHAVTFSPLPE